MFRGQGFTIDSIIQNAGQTGDAWGTQLIEISFEIKAVIDWANTLARAV